MRVRCTLRTGLDWRCHFSTRKQKGLCTNAQPDQILGWENPCSTRSTNLPIRDRQVGPARNPNPGDKPNSNLEFTRTKGTPRKHRTRSSNTHLSGVQTKIREISPRGARHGGGGETARPIGYRGGLGGGRIRSGRARRRGRRGDRTGQVEERPR